jgi:hypothetical protein|tara:strand:+ start:6490 stop:6837 length:348 start_codon:yes stop_codon:yes gene_type:complete
MARFTAIPAVPQGGITDWQSVLITSVKENVELLTGLRGEADLASKAVTKGEITLLEQPLQNMKQVSAKGSGFTISGQEVAGLDDYGLLLNDVQTLANDLAQTRSVLNLLIKQLRG